MINHLTIRGLGPHVDTTLELGGLSSTRIEGGSETGKSTALVALLWALCSDRPDAALLRSDCKRAEVIVRWRGSNTTAARVTLTPAGSQGYQVERAGQWVSCRSQRAYLDALGPIGADPDRTRLILSPFTWRELAEGPGGGRPLRDVLARLLSPGDAKARFALVRQVVQESWPECPADAVLEIKSAEEARREARREAQEAAGASKYAASALLAARANAPAQPVDGEVERARQVLAAYEQANAHRTWAAKQAAVERHRGALQALGEAPAAPKPLPNGTTADAERHLNQDNNALVEAQTRLKTIDGTSVDAHPEVVAAEARVPADGDRCPTCGRDGWEAAERAVIQAQEKREEVEHRRAEALESAREAVAAAEAKATESAAYLERCRQRDMLEHWRKRRAMLSDPPESPGEEPPRPAEVPTDAQGVAARQVLEAARDASVRAEEHAVGVKAAESAARKASAAAKKAEARLVVAGRLVEELRAAPTRILERQLAGLDLQTVELRPDGDGIRVLVDGRPWSCASRGRQARADLELREEIRKAAGMTWLPMVVDNAQDWSGDWPSTRAGIFLWTTGGPLQSSAAKKGAA